MNDYTHDYDLDLKSTLETLDDLNECLVCAGTGECTVCKNDDDCWYCDGTDQCHGCKGTGNVEPSDA